MSEKQVKSIIRIVATGLSGLVLLVVPDVPLPKPLRDLIAPLTVIPIDEIITKPVEPRPRERLSAAGPLSFQSLPAPYFSPTTVQAEPTQIVLSEPSVEKPEFGMISELFDRPPDNPEPVRMSPVASPLPDIISEHSDEGPAMPPAGLPGPVAQRGAVYRGAGSPSLEVSTEPSYTGPDLNLPSSDLPSAGLSHGTNAPGTSTPGLGPGEKYESNTGRAKGANLAQGLDSGGDIIGEGELSGLLGWLRKQRGDFPAVVRSYMETQPGDLLGVTSYSGWDIFVQFREGEHQLKIFLARGSSGILLADSDFKQRSQLFGMGNVSRDDQYTISTIEAVRQKPTSERTADFYRVFGGWMNAEGIQMGSRAAK